eukprot:gene6775-9478_t
MDIDEQGDSLRADVDNESQEDMALGMLSERPVISDAFKTFISMVIAKKSSGAPFMPSHSLREELKCEQEDGQNVNLMDDSLFDSSLDDIQALVRYTLRSLSSFDLALLNRSQQPTETATKYLTELVKVKSLIHATRLIDSKQKTRTKWLGLTYMKAAWPHIAQQLRSDESLSYIDIDIRDAFILAVNKTLAAGSECAMWCNTVSSYVQSQANSRSEAANANISTP